MGTDSSLITHHSPLTLKAPAKINWFLHVLGLRDDGFHEIRSLMQKVSLYDVLEISPAEDLTVITDLGIPTEQNLVYRAARTLMDRYGVQKGAMIKLSKHIPSGAGLGGGSSDAASTLMGLNSLWSLNIPHNELCGIGAGLGSDVPFFMHGAASFAQGRGERITPCRARKSLSVLLVKPPFPVSTSWAYNELKKAGHYSRLTKKPDKVDNIEFFISLIESAEFRKSADIISNDLEPVAIKGYPVIADIKQGLIREGAMFSLMSGSGSCVFGVFRSAAEAEKASQAFGDCWTKAVQTIID